MSDSDNARIEADRKTLTDAQAKGGLAVLGAYAKLSGPGWLQSAITLGGGSLAGSLYLGVLAGFAFLWVQPLAMILGIIMLSMMAYVTTSTGERPFPAINKHVSPVLGWGWLLAAAAANIFWCMPQFNLAVGAFEQNLLPTLFSTNEASLGSVVESLGVNGSKTLLVLGILVLTVAITWAYDSGSWGIKVYEILLKLMVAAIVLCFFGVVIAIAGEIDWSALFAGFIPSWSQLTEPTPPMAAEIAKTTHQDFWANVAVGKQQDSIIGAAATAVGINMTFLFPYSMLAKGWTKEFRGLAVFDLSTGMFIPFLLATSCVIIAAGSQFHYAKELPTSPEGLTGKATNSYYAGLEGLAKSDASGMSSEFKPYIEAVKKAKDAKDGDAEKAATAALRKKLDEMPEPDRRVALMLADRDHQDLADSLNKVAGKFASNYIFGLGVLGMALSTITMLMLISGFCFCEALGIPAKGWPHRFGCLLAGVGALGPFIWSQASFYLAVYVSAFGLMLLPIAYVSFLLLFNQKAFLGKEMATGSKRLTWNILAGFAATIASAASVYAVYKRLNWIGIGVMVGFVVLAVVVELIRRSGKPAAANDEPK